MPLHASDMTALIEKIKAEYREMPGLSLTRAQAQRVWHLEENHCQAILDALLHAKFLSRTRNGAFVRAGHRA